MSCFKLRIQGPCFSKDIHLSAIFPKNTELVFRPKQKTIVKTWKSLVPILLQCSAIDTCILHWHIHWSVLYIRYIMLINSKLPLGWMVLHTWLLVSSHLLIITDMSNIRRKNHLSCVANFSQATCCLFSRDIHLIEYHRSMSALLGM